MAIHLKVTVSKLKTSIGSAEEARDYLRALQTKQVIFLNGPESPGPCPRCLRYHRTVWRVTSYNRPIPPLHPNCYCSLVSYREPSGEVGKTKTYDINEFLAKRVRALNTANKEKLLGKGITRLLRLGIIEIEQLVTKARGIVTLTDHLRMRLGSLSVKNLNKLTDRGLLDLFEAFG